MASARRAGSRRQQEPQPGMHRHTSLGPEPPFLVPSRLLLLLLLGFSRRVMAFAHDKASQWHPGGPNPIPRRLAFCSE